MPFKKILIAVDGSKYSQLASGYGFWMATNITGAKLSAQHVIDPRLADLMIAPEFAEELGLSVSVDISDKVFSALRKIGNLILKVVSSEAEGRKLGIHTYLDEGHVIEEILKRAKAHDLVIVGHRGGGKEPVVSELSVGAIAERVAVGSKTPVLIAATPIDSLAELLVAYDGSEPSQGALLMAENLAKLGRVRLKATIVIADSSHKAEAELTIEQGKKLLREHWPEEVFTVEEGNPADKLLELASRDRSLLVVGAYGFRNPEANVMGRTVTSIVRKSNNHSLLIYR